MSNEKASDEGLSALKHGESKQIYIITVFIHIEAQVFNS